MERQIYLNGFAQSVKNQPMTSESILSLNALLIIWKKQKWKENKLTLELMEIIGSWLVRK